MKCFRCGSDNVLRTKRKHFSDETGERLEDFSEEHPQAFVPLQLGRGNFGPDTLVTLCQSCAGQQIDFLRGVAIPQAVIVRKLEVVDA